jgi:hypothetical protein
MDQGINRQQALAEIQIADGEVTSLPVAWFTCTPDHVRKEHEVRIKMEPLPEPAPATCSAFAVGDPVFLHSLTECMEGMNGYVGTIMDIQVGDDKEPQYDVFACSIPEQYTSDVKSLEDHKKWFESRNLSPLLGGTSDGISLDDAIAAGVCAPNSQDEDINGAHAERAEGESSVNSTFETRYIDKSRTFTSVQRGRAGGLLPPRPAMNDAHSMFLLGLPCDRDQGASPSDQHSCPVAKARLQGVTLLDLLRRREYGVVWQALLTLLDSQDRRRLRAAGAGLGDTSSEDDSSSDESSSGDESSSADQ